MKVNDEYPTLTKNVAAIESMYEVIPTPFWAGDHRNESGVNLKSLTVFSFAKLHKLSKQQTLSLFGEALEEVLKWPLANSHSNIRALIRDGNPFQDVCVLKIEGESLRLKPHLQIIEDAWEERTKFSPSNVPKELRNAVNQVICDLDEGRIRTAMKFGDIWFTNQMLKKAVLLSFRLDENQCNTAGHNNPLTLRCYDKVPLKSARWDDSDFRKAGYRAVPGSIVREGSFIGEKVVLMPCFVNIGAYVGEGTMVDTWATVGSCAQIGMNCHLSGGVGIGGVLEPLQANPTIIEDNCFIGARSEVVEGVVVREGSVLAMGCYISQSTKILDRKTGKITYGEIPPYSVVVPGSIPSADGTHSLDCVVIVKTVDAQTRSKTAINELLRD